MNIKDYALQSDFFVPLTGQDRDEAMAVFASTVQREAAETQIFVPRQLHISDVRKVEHNPNRRSIDLHLKDGKIINYVPSAPGLLKFFKGKGFIRAMSPVQVRLMDNAAHVLVERRIWLLDRLFKVLLMRFFPMMGFRPKSITEVYRIKKELFHFLYEEMKNEM